MKDMDITHLQKVEAGKVNVTMTTLVRLADGLDVQVADLFTTTPPTRLRKR